MGRVENQNTELMDQVEHKEHYELMIRYGLFQSHASEVDE